MGYQDTIQVLFSSGNYTLISYMKAGREEWNVARDYNAEEKTWSSGNYCYTLESALAVFLERTGSKFVKSDYQIEVERKCPELTYARTLELGTMFIHGLIEDDYETAMQYFSESCDMSEAEKNYFGLDENYEIASIDSDIIEQENNKFLDNLREMEPFPEESVIMPHVRRGR